MLQREDRLRRLLHVPEQSRSDQTTAKIVTHEQEIETVPRNQEVLIEDVHLHGKLRDFHHLVVVEEDQDRLQDIKEEIRHHGEKVDHHQEIVLRS